MFCTSMYRTSMYRTSMYGTMLPPSTFHAMLDVASGITTVLSFLPSSACVTNLNTAVVAVANAAALVF